MAGLIAIVAISHDPRDIDSAIAELKSADDFFSIPSNRRPISNAIFYFPEYVPEFEEIISNFEEILLESGLEEINVLFQPQLPQTLNNVGTKGWNSYKYTLKQYKQALSHRINSNYYFFISLLDMKNISTVIKQIITASVTPLNDLVLRIHFNFDGKIIPAVLTDSIGFGTLKTGQSLFIELTGIQHDGRHISYPIVASVRVLDEQNFTPMYKDGLTFRNVLKSDENPNINFLVPTTKIRFNSKALNIPYPQKFWRKFASNELKGFNHKKEFFITSDHLIFPITEKYWGDIGEKTLPSAIEWLRGLRSAGEPVKVFGINIPYNISTHVLTIILIFLLLFESSYMKALINVKKFDSDKPAWIGFDGGVLGKILYFITGIISPIVAVTCNTFSGLRGNSEMKSILIAYFLLAFVSSIYLFRQYMLASAKMEKLTHIE